MKKYSIKQLKGLLAKGIPIIIRDDDRKQYFVKRFGVVISDDIEDTENYDDPIDVVFVHEFPEYIPVQDISKFFVGKEVGVK